MMGSPVRVRASAPSKALNTLCPSSLATASLSSNAPCESARAGGARRESRSANPATGVALWMVAVERGWRVTRARLARRRLPLDRLHGRFSLTAADLGRPRRAADAYVRDLVVGGRAAAAKHFSPFAGPVLRTLPKPVPGQDPAQV